MSRDPAGPKEIALRDMREARLKALMSPARGKIAYAGREVGKSHPDNHVKAQQAKEKQTPIPKHKRKKRVSPTPRI